METTNSNPTGPIKLSRQSTAGVRLCSVFTSLSILCKNAGPKPFCWATPACFVSTCAAALSNCDVVHKLFFHLLWITTRSRSMIKKSGVCLDSISPHDTICKTLVACLYFTFTLQLLLACLTWVHHNNFITNAHCTYIVQIDQIHVLECTKNPY